MISEAEFGYHSRMNVPWRWMSGVGLVFATLACQESLTSPAQCPEFCPPEQIVVLDTLLVGVVTGDSSFRGYDTSRRQPVMQLVTEGTAFETRGVMRFQPFRRLLVGVGDSILGVDSFRLVVALRRRDPDVTGIELRAHRIPLDIDSAKVPADLAPNFQDSTLVGTAIVRDSVQAGLTHVVIPAANLPGVGGDSSQAALGVVMRSPTESFLDLGTIEGGQSPALVRFLGVRTPNDTITITDTAFVEFDNFLAPASGPVPDSVLAIGGLPSARSILRFNLPRALTDSSDVVRATLILVPVEPAAGPPKDGATLRADPLSRDVGRKSPVRAVNPIVPNSGGVAVLSGSVDTIRIDITDIMVGWRRDSTYPHAISLRSAPEAGRVFELRVHSSRSGLAPALLVSYVPPFVRRRQ